ncbi:hypothetical protein G0U57_017740 [Chelydra serpentina]|uniref:Beta-defensin-like domain-containing protein n=1 Tax=Chelydra serpentina TaxID=8475 RepID=A0A8T1SYQ6_CHESE|nr:hypothetical protein G0U57_017740 [Chelydra serpentina]
MKILYLLFAVFFLVLQSSPGFTQRISNSSDCTRAGGYCRRGSCYPRATLIGNCSRRESCCRRRR